MEQLLCVNMIVKLEHSNWGLGFNWCESKVKWAPGFSFFDIIHTEQASDEGPGHHDLSADLMKGPTQYYKYKRFPSLPLIPITHLKSEGKKKAKSSSLKLWHLLGTIGYALCVIIHILNEEASHVYINQYFTITIIIIITL